MKLAKIKVFQAKAFDILFRLGLLAATVLFCLWMISGARAASSPKITDIQANETENGGSTIRIKFSDPVLKNKISVEFERNFIQFSFRDVSAFPAKNKNIAEGNIDKIFTYQYQPDLARARILLSREAAKIKEKTSWSMDGNTLVVEIPNTTVIKQRAAAEDKNISQAAEDQVVKEILNEAKAAPSKKEAEPVFASEHSEKDSGKESLHERTQSPVQKVVSGLITVLVLLAAIALAFRKFVLGKGVRFGANRNEKMIDVVASHGISPKKSISVVRIADQYMVLGITGEHINLLTNLDAKANIEKYLQIEPLDLSFGRALNTKLVSDDMHEPKHTTTNTAASIRSSIKKRIEGFKQL